MGKLIAHKIPATLFHYSATHKEFVTEASELPKTFNPQMPINDTDTGFIMIGNSVTMTFKFVEEERYGDEIESWLYVAEPADNPEFNLNESIKCVIVND